ncbi:hypothetical protein FRC11_001520, partial [Ceratobasidium sp. 423]
VFAQLIKRMPTFHMYEPDGYWPIDCLLLAALKSSKDAHDRQQRQIKINGARKIDEEAQKQELVKKQEAAVARGLASVKARGLIKPQEQVEADTPVRIQEDAAPPVQVNTEPLAEAWTETNTGDRDASELQASDGSDGTMDAIVEELSSMSILITNDADTPMDEADSGEPVLPADLVEPSPPTQVSVATRSATLEAPPTSDTPHTPATLDLSTDAMQVKLERLKILSPAARAQLPVSARLLLNMIDTGSQLADPELLADILSSIPNTYTSAPPASSSAPLTIFATSTPAPGRPKLNAAPTCLSTATSTTTSAPVPQPKEQAKPKMRPPPPPSPLPPRSEPKAAYIPTVATTNLPALTDSSPALGTSSVLVVGSATRLDSRRSPKVLTINELEPGPTNLEVDDDDNDDNDDDPLEDLSPISDSAQRFQPKEILQKTKSKNKSTGTERARGKVGAGQGVGRGAAKSADATPQTEDEGTGRARGRGRGRGRGQSSPANDSGPATLPTVATRRTMRMTSQK